MKRLPVCFVISNCSILQFKLSNCVCVLLGRPDPRMYNPYVIGRDSWVWDKQKALYKIIPPQSGGGGPNWNGTTRRENSAGGVRA